jgi:3-phosphoshikimate 1-carboxyvinyltransferase
MTSNNPSQTAVIRGPRRTLRGSLSVPGDKSISHRALLLGGIASGETRVQGLLEGEDCQATLGAMRRLGVTVEKQGSG